MVVRVCWLWMLGVVAVTSMFVLALVTTWETAYVVGGVGFGILRLSIPLMIPYVLLLMRTGRWVSIVSHDELQQLIQTGDADFVGEAWSFWLAYVRPSGRRIVSMSRSYAGIVELREDTVTVRSGTRLGDLQRVLTSHGKTLLDRSQFDNMTVGGALRTSAHGCYVGTWLVSTVVSARVAIRGSSRIENVLSDRLSRLLNPNVVILLVTFRIVDNQERTFVNREWKREEDIELDEYCTSDYRMLFVRSHFVNAKYLMPRQKHDDDVALPLRGQFVRQQILHCARDYRRPTTVASAQSFVHDLDFVETISIHCLSYINAELFVRTATPLASLIQHLLRFHNVHGGRTEVREQGYGERRIVALDIAFHGRKASHLVQEYLRGVKKVCAVHTVALHGGKFQLTSTKPLRLVPNAQFFHADTESYV